MNENVNSKVPSLDYAINMWQSLQTITKPVKSGRASGSDSDKLIVGMIVYDGFELLDTFGPLTVFGVLNEHVEIVMVGQHPGAVKSSCGPATLIDKTFEELDYVDILLVPGGMGCLTEIENKPLLDYIQKVGEKAQYVGTICTGAAIVAKTSLLDGKRATTNKVSFGWVAAQNENIEWIKEARWVEDGKYWTSSGVSAGTDMAIAMLAHIFGEQAATIAADMAEYEWNNDPHHDIFAKKCGLIS
jgi:putative intracellular protease/amidase